MSVTFAKHVLVACLLVATCGLTCAQEFDLPGILSSHVDVDPFLAEVRREGKPGVVFVTQPWCGALASAASATDS